MGFPTAFQSYIPRSHCVSSHVYGVIIVTPERETVVIRGRQSGKWSFPKGHGASTENPLEASIRELREETGINLKGRKPDDELRFKVGTYFVFYLTEKQELCPEDTKEVIDSMWVPLERILRVQNPTIFLIEKLRGKAQKICWNQIIISKYRTD